MKTPIKKFICRFNQLLGRFDGALFLLGDGRSGTTWLQRIINFDGRFREMFEPFNAREHMELDYESHYFFPESIGEPPIQKHYEKSLRGDFMNMKISYKTSRFLYEGLLIKDISSHLILDQLFDSAKPFKQVMVLRHPFAVALSKTKSYSWPTLPELFLAFESTRTILKPFHRWIKNSEEPLLNHVLVWCIIHRIAFAAEAIKSFNFLFYENLAYHPTENIIHVFEAFDQLDRYEKNRAEIKKVVKKRSRVTAKENSIDYSNNGRARWIEEWPAEIIEAGLEILEAFELDFLYGREHFPKIDPHQLKSRLNELSLKREHRPQRLR